MAKLTQGTQVYFIDPDDDSVNEIEKALNFDGGGAPADQIETTALDDSEKTYMQGMRTPGQATLEINADPTKDSHVRLKEIADDSTVNDQISFCVGWSDGTTDPEVDSDGEFDFSGATGRTWCSFKGYVGDFPFNFGGNSVVKTTILIQKQTKITWTPATT